MYMVPPDSERLFILWFKLGWFFPTASFNSVFFSLLMYFQPIYLLSSFQIVIVFSISFFSYLFVYEF